MSAKVAETRGIVYVATRRDFYVEEAQRSAESAKEKNPDIPITLFTDREGHPLCASGCFDSVIAIEAQTCLASGWAEGQLNRVYCLSCTPYQYTLHLDTDTTVLTDELPELFDLLNDIDVAMVETSTDDSYSRYHFGQPMFNGGVILYRKNELTWKWLQNWAGISERNFQLASSIHLPELPILTHVDDEIIRRRLLCIDQTSLVELLSPQSNQLGLKVKILDYSWNYRGSALPENNRQAVRILHLPRQQEKADVSNFAVSTHTAYGSY
jgi:hypothetical protein